MNYTQAGVYELDLQSVAKRIYESQGVKLDTNSIFDVQVKRLHEYKRQLLNALHIMYVYNELKNNPEFKANYHPHTFIFGAKSAPSYYFAKKVIKLINTIADKVNNDPETNSFNTTNVEEVIFNASKRCPDATIIIKSTIPIGFVIYSV